jgi:hypothetical protein
MADEQAGWRKFVAEATAATISFQPAPLTEAAAPSPLPGGFPSPPAFDVIERLAHIPASADKLRLQRDRCSERRAAMIPHSELQEAIAECTRDEQNLRRLQARPQDDGLN